MREHITHVAFDMHQDSITAAWLPPGASTPELRTIPHEPKPFRRLVKEIPAHGPACACYEAGPWATRPSGNWKPGGCPVRSSRRASSRAAPASGSRRTSGTRRNWRASTGRAN
jgi:hypothetical protein